ncbi:ATP-binding protein [Amycolatopsis sp. NPDC051758]|uniref:ATP-binding protein n=1 Tax=Amycolatopsis sp. NPDC051758 TaxID=3363935 RepID=UPI00378CBA18
MAHATADPEVDVGSRGAGTASDGAVQPLVRPAEMKSFVGRTDLLNEIKQRLSSTQLLTLTGPGGVGKTRLLLRLEKELAAAGTYRDGVVAVWLEKVKPVDDHLESALATALGILNNSTKKHPLARLLEHLRHREMLLLLDNCEHLLGEDQIPRLLRTLLPNAEGLQVVATSRDLLGVEGEKVVHVPPLHVAELSAQAGVVDRNVHEALALFLDRADARGYPIDPADYPVAARLCGVLDGLPLAIELAAGALGAMSVSEMVASPPPDLLNMLVDGSAEQRHHRKLHSTIAWSYGLLEQPEQRMWALCSVFEGSFDATAAAAICRDRGIDEIDVRPLLGALVRKSVLVREPHRGRTRFSMLGTIRSFGKDLLTEAEAAGLRDAHADYFEAWTGRVAETWFGPNEDELLDDLDAEQPNSWAAQEHLLSAPDTALRGLILPVSVVGTRYFFLAGNLNTGRKMLDLGLKAHPEEPTLLQVAALSLAVHTALCQGDQERAAPLLAAAEAAAHQLDCFDSYGPILYARATSLWLTASGTVQNGESLALFQSAMDAFQAEGSFGFRWMAWLFRVMDAGFAGERDIAIAESEALLAEARAAGAKWCISWALWACALVEMRFGDPWKALSLAQQALRIQDDIGDKWGWVWTVWLIALIAILLGFHELGGEVLGATMTAQEDTEVSLPGLLPWLRLQTSITAMARRQLGDARWESQLEIGKPRGRGLQARKALLKLVTDDFPAAPPAAPDVRPGGLTEREYEIVELVATGRTNREIGEELKLSRRTIDSHVQRIFRRLNLGSRVEVTRWFVAQASPARHT